MKKLFSVFLSLLITSGVLISDVSVTHAETKEPIQVGDSVYATLDDYGTLTISGDGDMWEKGGRDKSTTNYLYAKYSL